MTHLTLEVPFAEKDDAKRLGARWDATHKVWYVPDGVNPAVFGRWLPKVPVIGIQSERYFIAETEKVCWKCNERTSVYGFVLPAGFTMLDEDEDEEKEAWFQYDEPTIVHYVTDLFPDVQERIKEFTQHYRLDSSKMTKSSYWMNHCQHCGMKQGDFEMYCEPGGAFHPYNESAASKITLYEFSEPFGCNGDVVYGDLMIEYMQRA